MSTLDGAHGHARQSADCAAWTKWDELEHAGTYSDSGVSRDAWHRLVADADARRFELVVLWSLDRLPRLPGGQEPLQVLLDTGVFIACANGTLDTRRAVDAFLAKTLPMLPQDAPLVRRPKPAPRPRTEQPTLFP